MLVFVLVASLGLASGARALEAKTALRQNFLSHAERVGDFGLEAREMRQENRAVSTIIASECCDAARGGVLEGANFAQKTFGRMFSKGGAFAGRSVDDVAGALRSGAMKPSEVPIDYIVREGNTLILNTRSAQALEAAGIPRSAWTAVNRTGQEMYEAMLSGQLQRNGLTSVGTATVRQSGL